MKNIGIIMDINAQSGGKLQMAMSICGYLKKIRNYNFTYIVTYKDSKKIIESELNINLKLFEKTSFINRLLNRCKKIIKVFPFKTPFENFLEKNNINYLFFLDPSPMVKDFKKLNFTYTIFDIEHRENKDLDEYKNNVSSKRERDYFYACEKCSALVVGTRNLKEKISDIYNIEHEKIFDLIFPPPIINSKKAQSSAILDIIEKKNIKNNFILYPAQFWSHKNHQYIIDAIYYMKKKDNLKYKIIFTGHDRGNLNKIKNSIKEKKIKEDFIIFDYIEDSDLSYLYRNCLAVVIPTIVAPHTFPLYEAFYFRKPVIYNLGVLDNSLKKRVIGLDINDIASLENALRDVEDQNKTKDLIDSNYKYFEEIFNEEKILKKLDIILKKGLY